MNDRTTKIKICGIKDIQTVEALNIAGADFAGFMFYPKSRRFISAEDAVGLKKELSASIKTVGVFVDAEPEEILKIVRSGVIDMIQLHGNENESYIKNIKELSMLPVIKAFRIDSRDDADKAEKSPADFILLDNGAGGTGKSFDWELIKGIEREYFLAGGLNPENVGRACKELNPWAVDVSSGVEENGVKDPEKIISFCKNVRTGENYD